MQGHGQEQGTEKEKQARFHVPGRGVEFIKVWTRREHKRQDTLNISVGRETSALLGTRAVALSATRPFLKQCDPMSQFRQQRSGC
jgi:hypothetical protein